MKYDDLRNMTEAERLETYRGMQNAHETFTWDDTQEEYKKANAHIPYNGYTYNDIPKIKGRKFLGYALVIIWGVVIWMII